MTPRAALSLALVAGLLALPCGCGRYGPPRRAPVVENPQPPAPQPPGSEDSDEEESQQKPQRATP